MIKTLCGGDYRMSLMLEPCQKVRYFSVHSSQDADRSGPQRTCTQI